MVKLSRKIILDSINDLLQRVRTPYEVYTWALGLVVSKEFDEFAAADPFAAKVMAIILSVNEDHKVSLRELKILEYYRQCLVGERESISIEDAAGLPDVPQEIIDRWREGRALEQGTPELKDNILSGLKIYIYIFGGYVLLSNLLMLFQLGNPWAAERALATITYPFFFYGGLLLLPMQVLVKKRFFTLTLMLSIVTFAYFWFEFFRHIFWEDFNLHVFLVRLFLGAIPASVVIWILVYEKYLKHRKSAE